MYKRAAKWVSIMWLLYKVSYALEYAGYQEKGASYEIFLEKPSKLLACHET